MACMGLFDIDLSLHLVLVTQLAPVAVTKILGCCPAGCCIGKDLLLRILQLKLGSPRAIEAKELVPYAILDATLRVPDGCQRPVGNIHACQRTYTPAVTTQPVLQDRVVGTQLTNCPKQLSPPHWGARAVLVARGQALAVSPATILSSFKAHLRAGQAHLRAGHEGTPTVPSSKQWGFGCGRVPASKYSQVGQHDAWPSLQVSPGRQPQQGLSPY